MTETTPNFATASVESKKRGATPLPSVTIVIPARDEADTIAKTLASIQQLDYPSRHLECIVVDNGSRDATAAVARSFSGVQVIDAPHIKVGAVRNLGAAVGKGEVIAFFDADVIVPPNLLKAAVGLLAETGAGAVGGACPAAYDATWVARAWALVPPQECFETESLAGASFIVPRAVFLDVGGFDEQLSAGEDDELSLRIRRSGRRVLSHRDCDVEHLGYPSTLAGIFRRQVWHGSSQLDAAKHPLEPMLILTHGFLISLAAVPATALFAAPLWPLFVGAGMGICLLSALQRERRSESFSPIRLVQRTVIFGAYFLGRSWGLILNYVQRLRRIGAVALPG